MAQQRSPYTLNSNFIIQNYKNTYSIFDPDSSTLFTLNTIGSEIIQAIIKKRQFELLYTELSQQYNVEPTLVKKDLNDFIRLLLKKNIIFKN